MGIEKKHLRILGAGIIILLLGVIVCINRGQPARVSFCGDSHCDGDESATSCADDCLLSQPCMPEGESFIGGGFADTPVIGCCAGLQERAVYDDLSRCLVNKARDVCINCGNSKCGPAENICNCPEDCKNMKDIIFYAEYAAWGPCPPNMTCHSNTTIYISGKRIVNGNITYLDSARLSEAQQKIREHGLMDKNCSAGLVMDYFETVEITLDGKSTSISFPGCEEELRDVKSTLLD